MRIFEVIPNLQVGGAEKFVVELSNALAESGHEVYLITLFPQEENEQFASLLKGVKRIALNKRLGFDFKCVLELKKIVQQYKPQIIHAHTEAVKYMLPLSLMYRNSKYFATIHSDAQFDSGSGSSRLIRKFIFKSHLVYPVTISKTSHESFLRFYNVNATLIENGCSDFEGIKNDLSYLRKDTDYLFVNIASIQPVKNQLMLIKAFKEFLGKGYNARLLIIGKTIDEQIHTELERYASENILLLGEKDNIRDYLAIADAFCLSSTIEGMPITLLEAMSTKCIPIVTPAGGCADIISHKTNGLITKTFNQEEYLEMLIAFTHLTDEEKMEMKKKLYELFQQKYSISSSAKSYIELFEKHL